jgi:hypothetical protein
MSTKGWDLDRCTGRSIDHPGRKLQQPIHCNVIATAAENVLDLLLNYFVDANKPTKPRMPLIQHSRFSIVPRFE